MRLLYDKARFAKEVAEHQTLVAGAALRRMRGGSTQRVLGDPLQADQASAAVTSAVATATRPATDTVGPSGS